MTKVGHVCLCRSRALVTHAWCGAVVDASAETVKLLVQWHEVCFEAGSLLPCDVTCLTEQFSLVSPLTVVRVVLVVPQFALALLRRRRETLGA